MRCPLCGEFTHKASTRLIRDTCGHLKCRLCLLKEENGCRVCEAEHRIDSIGSFNYSVPSTQLTDYEFPNCEPFELTHNKIPVNLEENDLSQSVQKDTEVDESNLQGQNNDVPTTTNEINQLSEFNNIAENQNTDKQKVSTSETTELIENTNSNENKDSHDLNNSRALVINDKREETTDDAQNKHLNIQKNLQNENESNENQIVYQVDSSVSLSLTENLSQATNSEVDNSSTSHSEEISSNLPNKTPKQLGYTIQELKVADPVGSPYRSPAFRLSDYLTFNKRNENGDSSPLSANYRSPAFRLSDYIVFKEKCIQDEVTHRIEKVLNDGENKSGDYVSSDGFLVQRISADDESSMIETEDDLQNNYFNEPDTAIAKSLTVSETPKTILKKRVTLNNTVSSNPKHSQNETCDLKGRKSSLLKQARKKRDETEDDEDKENKRKLNKKNKRKLNKEKDKTTKRSTKLKNDAKTAALKKVNRTSATKTKTVNSLKTKSNKQKKIEDNLKLNDEPIATRRGERIRKRKILIYENEVLEVVTKKRRQRSASPKPGVLAKQSASPTYTPPSKRGRKSKDWSHVIRLPGTPARYRCNVCNASFTHWRGRVGHAACRVGEPPFRCKICERTFYKRTHFEYHERTHAGEKPYTCKLCDKSFVQKYKLNRHVLVHKLQQDIECDICGKKFYSKESVKRHLISHQKKRRFECSKCPKTFTLADNRKRHELTHSMERPFACDICSKTFKSKYLVTRHRRLHDKSRPFTCEHCDRVFLNKFALKRHIVIHTDVKPFVCEICKTEFRRVDNYKRHVKYHHYPDSQADDVPTGDSTDSDDQRLIIAVPLVSEVPANKGKPLNVEKKKGNKKKASGPNEVKNPKKSKTILRTNSTTDKKGSPTVSKENTNEKSSTVPISIRPTNSKFLFVDDIPREEALLLNQQIETKVHAQRAFCNFPGLTRKVDLHVRRKSTQSNSNSNDATAIQQNQEKEKNCENVGVEEPKQIEPTFIHWRRRTANSFLLVNRAKSQEDVKKKT